MEAFVYCWTDHLKDMLYIGSHKGDPHDGYICSSKIMMKEYKARPQDFTRSIVAEGMFQDMAGLESIILQCADAAHDPHYYNQHNNDGKFYNLNAWNKGLTKATDYRVAKYSDTIGKTKKGSTLTKLRKFTKSSSHFTTGHIPWNKGLGTNIKISKGKAKSKEHSQKIAKSLCQPISTPHGIFPSKKEAATALHMDQHTIRKYLKTNKPGWEAL